jgi:hypothetical protein
MGWVNIVAKISNRQARAQKPTRSPRALSKDALEREPSAGRHAASPKRRPQSKAFERGASAKSSSRALAMPVSLSAVSAVGTGEALAAGATSAAGQLGSLLSQSLFGPNPPAERKTGQVVASTDREDGLSDQGPAEGHSRSETDKSHPLSQPAVIGKKAFDSIEQEEIDVPNRGQYKWPNEYFTHLLLPSIAGLGSQGDYLGVAALRPRNAVGKMGGGKGFKAILLDYDFTQRDFNKRLDELILKSPNRLEFLARLFNHPAPDSLNPTIHQIQESGRVDTQLDWDFLDQVGKGIWQTTDLDTAGGIFRFRSILLQAPEHWRESFWGTDGGYETSRDLVREGAFVPLAASLFGSKTVPQIAELYRSSGKKIAVLDASNAIDWARDEDMRQLSKNVLHLPPSENARFLFTSDRPVPNFLGLPNDSSKWTYFSVPYQRLADFAQSGKLNSRDGWTRFEQEARDANVSKNEGLVIL